MVVAVVAVLYNVVVLLVFVVSTCFSNCFFFLVLGLIFRFVLYCILFFFSIFFLWWVDGVVASNYLRAYSTRYQVPFFSQPVWHLCLYVHEDQAGIQPT